MNFTEKIHALEAKLLQALVPGQSVSELAPAVLKQFDWSDFERKDVLPFLRVDLPRQYYGPYSFGRFNLTLRWNEHFSIQIYFMEDISTEIHPHAFHGYFYYLEGQVLETTFKRLPGEEVAPGIRKNGLAVEHEKILSSFEGKAIVPGPIHQVSRLSPVSTVLMIMQHGREPIPEEFILPTGHIIAGKAPSDRFLRLLTLLETTPELQADILNQMAPADMALHCFRNGDISVNKNTPAKAMVLEALREHLPVDEVLDAYATHAKKILKLKQIGAMP